MALSGGGDFLALMHLLADWARTRKLAPPVALIVDHALRKESAAEARKAAVFARKAGLAAHILIRKGPAPQSGIEAAARDARYSLMGNWMRRHGIATLYVGHTLDDQAEHSCSGWDGAAVWTGSRPRAPWRRFRSRISPISNWRGRCCAYRVRRCAISETAEPGLVGRSHEQRGAFRPKPIRGLMRTWKPAGLSPLRIADAAAHLARARTALELATEAVIARAARADGARVLVDGAALMAAPREVGLRALARLLMTVSGLNLIAPASMRWNGYLTASGTGSWDGVQPCMAAACFRPPARARLSGKKH